MMKRYALVCFALALVLAVSSALAVSVPVHRTLLADVPAAPALPGYSIHATEFFTCLVLDQPRTLDSLILTDGMTLAEYTFVPDGGDGTVYLCDTLTAVPDAGTLLLQWSEQGGSASAAVDLAGQAETRVSLTFPDPGMDVTRDKAYRYDPQGSLTGYVADGVDVAFDSEGRLSSYSYTADDGAQVRFKGDNTLDSIIYVDGVSSYFYNPADGWQTFNELTGRLTPCAAPAGVDAADYPACALQTPPPSPSPSPTPTPTPSPSEGPSPTPGASSAPSDGPQASATPEPETPIPAPTSAPTPTPEPTPVPTHKASWYDHNTVCLAGLPVRELFPERTDRWYPVVPIDLTRQGVQTYDLVASNLFVIGQAAVLIDGDGVTVVYGLAKGEGYVKDECLRWFTTLADVTADFLEKPEGGAAFGETISIEKDLKGQDTALLFICNTVTYSQPYAGQGYLPRYWPNLPQRVAERESMAELMDRMGK